MQECQYLCLQLYMPQSLVFQPSNTSAQLKLCNIYTKLWFWSLWRWKTGQGQQLLFQKGAWLQKCLPELHWIWPCSSCRTMITRKYAHESDFYMKFKWPLKDLNLKNFSEYTFFILINIIHTLSMSHFMILQHLDKCPLFSIKLTGTWHLNDLSITFCIPINTHFNKSIIDWVLVANCVILHYIYKIFAILLHKIELYMTNFFSEGKWEGVACPITPPQ